jgi:hypothetical protein
VAAGKVGNRRHDSRTAGAVGTISNAIAKVRLAAEAGRIGCFAAELGVLTNYVIHAGLLGKVSS